MVKTGVNSMDQEKINSILGRIESGESLDDIFVGLSDDDRAELLTLLSGGLSPIQQDDPDEGPDLSVKFEYEQFVFSERFLEQNVDFVVSKIDKIIKKTARFYKKNSQKYGLRVNELSYRLSEPELISTGSLDEGNLEEKYYVTITITGDIPKVPGWEFLGTCEPNADHSENIFYPRKGFAIPEEYRKKVNICDHCGYSRDRNFTYIIKKVETGEHKQVGSTCMRDFISRSVASVLKYIKNLEEQLEDLNKLEEHGGYVGPKIAAQRLSIPSFSKMSLMLILYEGFRKKSGDKYPTAAKAWAILDRSDTNIIATLPADFFMNYGKRADDTISSVLSVISLKFGNSDDKFEREVFHIFQQDSLTYKQIFFAAAGIWSAYRYHNKKLREMEEVHSEIPDGKYKGVLVCVSSELKDGSYGQFFLTRFREINSVVNRFVLFSKRRLIVGAMYAISGIISGDKFKGSGFYKISKASVDWICKKCLHSIDAENALIVDDNIVCSYCNEEIISIVEFQEFMNNPVEGRGDIDGYTSDTDTR